MGPLAPVLHRTQEKNLAKKPVGDLIVLKSKFFPPVVEKVANFRTEKEKMPIIFFFSVHRQIFPSDPNTSARTRTAWRQRSAPGRAQEAEWTLAIEHKTDAALACDRRERRKSEEALIVVAPRSWRVRASYSLRWDRNQLFEFQYAGQATPQAKKSLENRYRRRRDTRSDTYPSLTSFTAMPHGAGARLCLGRGRATLAVWPESESNDCEERRLLASFVLLSFIGRFFDVLVFLVFGWGTGRKTRLLLFSASGLCTEILFLRVFFCVLIRQAGRYACTIVGYYQCKVSIMWLVVGKTAESST